MAAGKAARSVARFLGIKEDPPRDNTPEEIRGLSEPYYEHDATTPEFFREHAISADSISNYVRSLFPFWSWIFHYNLQWCIGDLIAGITVGFVVVPQGMAYALLANLPPEYGLYTSFVGFLLYWAFATSKDITIGTVAVMSTIVGNVVLRVQTVDPNIPAEQIARGLALISGCVLLFLGLIRAGFIVEFISLNAIASFMTGAAISIAADPTYLVIINTLKTLPQTKLDAAMGLTALFALYFIRWFCGFMGRKQPRNQKIWFFVSTLRMAFIILLYILVSWLANRSVTDAKKAKFKILGTVPSGFQHAGIPHIDRRLLEVLAPDIPVAIIVLIIEHIAISKSFGRINNYIIDPSQELVAIGFTNVFGPFLGGYPATGSFSRTAIKAKAGVRTPLAGIFTAVVVLLALYALTSVFFYIPSASLAALIIHAVGDLITPPRTVYQFWKTSPIETIIFFAGVILTIFTNIENGIYLNVAASAAVLLYRIAKAPGRVLGRTKVLTVSKETLEGSAGLDASAINSGNLSREAFIPIDHTDGSNPAVRVTSPHPGIFVYRFSEGFNYTNSARHLDQLTVHVYKYTRRTQFDKFSKLGDRPWNDPGPRRGQKFLEDLADRPTLRAVILDFSAVNFVDVTSVQALIDLRFQFGRYASPQPVEWHFAGVSNRWTKRALVAAGFGGPSTSASDKDGAVWNPLFSVAAVDGGSSFTVERRNARVTKGGAIVSGDDLEVGNLPKPTEKVTAVGDNEGQRRGSDKIVPVLGLNRPFFHIDIAAAVEGAIISAKSRRPI